MSPSNGVLLGLEHLPVDRRNGERGGTVLTVDPVVIARRSVKAPQRQLSAREEAVCDNAGQVLQLCKMHEELDTA